MKQVAAELRRSDVRQRGGERGGRGGGDGAARGLGDLLGPLGRRFRSNTYLSKGNTNLCEYLEISVPWLTFPIAWSFRLDTPGDYTLLKTT